MSKLNTTAASKLHTRAVDEINEIIAAGGASIMSPDLAAQSIGMESLESTALATLQQPYDNIVQQLQASSLGTEILAHADEEHVGLAMEAAALTILAAGNLSLYQESSAAKPSVAGDGIMVDPRQGSNDLDMAYGMEAFDVASMDKYIAVNAFANAMAVINGDFESVWFPTQIVPAGQDGVEVTVRIPKVFSGVTRTVNGVPVEFTKHSIIDGLIDSSVLDAEITTIVPYASDATTPASLIPAAKVATTTRVIDGVSVDTRPILFGQAVDLIGISSAPGLISNGAFDETDSLDDVINVGTVYTEITVTDGTTPVTVIVATNISKQLGSLLTKVGEGDNYAYSTNLEAEIVLSDSMSVVSGDVAAFITTIEGLYSLVANTKFLITATLSLSATANTETAKMEVFANRFTLAKAFDAAGVEVSIAPLSASTLTGLGYFPDTARSASNLHSGGTIIDSTGSVRYKFPIPLGAPFISQNPIGAPINTTVEGLGHAIRIRNNNNAVKALMNMEATLQSGNGVAINSPAIGSTMVTPTLVTDSLDVAVVVDSQNSKDALENLRGHLVATMTNAANKMIQDSGYLAGLQFATGSNDGYEIIVVTDSHIGSHLMSSGDARTFGTNHKFVITTSLNSAFKGKIYLSLRRTSRDGISPLDAGATLMTPSLTYDLQVSKGGATVKQIRTVPRSVSYATLPVLSVITVDNLDTIFTT